MNLLVILAIFSLTKTYGASNYELPNVSLNYEDSNYCKDRTYLEDDLQTYLNWIRALPVESKVTQAPTPVPSVSPTKFENLWNKIIDFGAHCLNLKKDPPLPVVVKKEKKYREQNLLKNFDLKCIAGAASHAQQAEFPRGKWDAFYMDCNTKKEAHRPCITSKFTEAISESFGTLQSCFGLSSAETEKYFWKFAHESGFFPNIMSHTYVPGVGQLSGIARKDVLIAIRNKTETYREVENSINQKIVSLASTDTGMVNTCKKLKTVMSTQLEPPQDTNYCSKLSTPPQPMLDMINGMIYSRLRCKDASKEVIPKLKLHFKNDVNAQKNIESMKEYIDLLAYNAGESEVLPIYEYFIKQCKDYYKNIKYNNNLSNCVDDKMRNSNSADPRITEKARYVVKIKDLKNEVQAKAPGKCGKL